jgi:hypothetical protein
VIASQIGIEEEEREREEAREREGDRMREGKKQRERIVRVSVLIFIMSYTVHFQPKSGLMFFRIPR